MFFVAFDKPVSAEQSYRTKPVGGDGVFPQRLTSLSQRRKNTASPHGRLVIYVTYSLSPRGTGDVFRSV